MVSRFRLERRSEGFAFVAALMVMLVLAILIAGVLAMAVSARNLSASRQEYTQALYVAESGINKLISDWRAAGIPNQPAQPFQGSVTNGGSSGSYSVTWKAWEPEPGLIRNDVVVMTSRGTVNDTLRGTIYNLARTVQVNLDTNGDWAWEHVYYSDPNRSGYPTYPYANINGNSGVVTPSDPLDEHAPGAGKTLPTPKWDQWRATALAQDALPYPSAFVTNTATATTARHVYWYGNTAGSHTGAGHTHRNSFLVDPYFAGLSYPDAYVCQPSASKTFEVIIDCSGPDAVQLNGLYFVNGDVTIKGGGNKEGQMNMNGTLVATGSIRTQGQVRVTIVPMIQNADDCAARTIYPAMIAGEDVLVTDHAVFQVHGIIYAGRSFTARASTDAGCIVSPSITLSGNFGVSYGFDTTNPACPRYEPGDSPPPMFNEPDKNQMEPVPRSWREL